MNNPKVSALCVTRARVGMLRRAVQCFLEQTYTNKELIIVYELDDVETCKFAEELKSDGVVVFVPVSVKPNKLTLGALRNISLMKASGKFVIQWDDDDWYSVYRIEFMLRSLLIRKKHVVFLDRWLILDKKSGQAYLSPVRNWEGSLLANKDILIKLGGYVEKRKSEDTVLMKKIVSIPGLSFKVSAPHLYIYVGHGNNTWDDKHFQMFVRRGSDIGGNVMDKLCMNAVLGRREREGREREGREREGRGCESCLIRLRYWLCKIAGKKEL